MILWAVFWFSRSICFYNLTCPSSSKYPSLCLMFGCGSQYLLPSTALGSLPDDYALMHEYSRISFCVLVVFGFYPRSLSNPVYILGPNRLLSGVAWAPSCCLGLKLTSQCPHTICKPGRLWNIYLVAGSVFKSHNWKSNLVPEDD